MSAPALYGLTGPVSEDPEVRAAWDEMMEAHRRVLETRAHHVRWPGHATEIRLVQAEHAYEAKRSAYGTLVADELRRRVLHGEEP